MKKLLSISALLILVAMAVTSCEKKHEPNPPKFMVTVDGRPAYGAIVDVIQGEPTTFAVQEADIAQKNSVKWVFNGTQVGTEPTYVLEAPEAGNSTLIVSMTNSDNETTAVDLAINVKPLFSQGTFVLSEGNMSNENGSLFFVSDKGKVADNVYFTANNSHLGNVAQDMFIANDKAYIISQNGNRAGGDGILVVAHANTFKKIEAVNEELKTLSWPSNLAVVGTMVYIRDNNGVSSFDMMTKKLSLVAGTRGASKNRMAVVAGRVFVPAGNNIYVIKDSKVDTIKFKGQVSGVIKADGDNLWVSCATTPARISKVDGKSLSIIKTNIFDDFSVSAGWGVAPAISAIKDTIYFSGNTTKISRHIFSLDKTEAVVDVATLVDDSKMMYGNLGVNPRTGHIFFTTIKDYAFYKDNSIAVIDARGAQAKLVENYKGYTRFPAGVFFTGNF